MQTAATSARYVGASRSASPPSPLDCCSPALRAYQPLLRYARVSCTVDPTRVPMTGARSKDALHAPCSMLSATVMAFDDFLNDPRPDSEKGQSGIVLAEKIGHRLRRSMPASRA